ncbi:MAG: hypothetical protein M3275_13275, partial [Thermoproteota archaeon]|nr:hypothetical protein [Thermoproteota archaeon]
IGLKASSRAADNWSVYFRHDRLRWLHDGAEVLQSVACGSEFRCRPPDRCALRFAPLLDHDACPFWTVVAANNPYETP